MQNQGIRRSVVALLLTMFLFGCAHVTRERILQKASGIGSLEEIHEESTQIPEGYSLLFVKAWIKIPQEDYYPFFKRRPSRDETFQYPFVLNIDGQGMLWTANGTLDEQRTYINNERNSEGGIGLKYYLEKRIHLRVGSYKVYMGLPEEEFETEVVISLADGSSNVLEFKPIYWRGGNRTRKFQNGISDFDIFLNGKRCPTQRIH